MKYALFAVIALAMLPSIALAQADCEPQPVDPQQPVPGTEGGEELPLPMPEPQGGDELPLPMPSRGDETRPDVDSLAPATGCDASAIPEVRNGTFVAPRAGIGAPDPGVMANVCEDIGDWKGAAQEYERAGNWKKAAENWEKLEKDLAGLGDFKGAADASARQFKARGNATLAEIAELQKQIHELERALAAEEARIRGIHGQPLHSQDVDALLDAQRRADDLKEKLAELKRKLDELWKKYNATRIAEQEDRQRIERERKAAEAKRAEGARKADEERKKADADAKKAEAERKAAVAKAAADAKRAEEERRRLAEAERKKREEEERIRKEKEQFAEYVRNRIEYYRLLFEVLRGFGFTGHLAGAIKVMSDKDVQEFAGACGLLLADPDSIAWLLENLPKIVEAAKKAEAAGEVAIEIATSLPVKVAFLLRRIYRISQGSVLARLPIVDTLQALARVVLLWWQINDPTRTTAATGRLQCLLEESEFVRDEKYRPLWGNASSYGDRAANILKAIEKFNADLKKVAEMLKQLDTPGNRSAIQGCLPTGE